MSYSDLALLDAGIGPKVPPRHRKSGPGPDLQRETGARPDPRAGVEMRTAVGAPCQERSFPDGRCSLSDTEAVVMIKVILMNRTTVVGWWL